MTQLPPPPPGLDIHASRQASIYAASITTEALALVAVVLRFWCRKMTKTAYRLDDWLVVAAAVSIYQSFYLHVLNLMTVEILSIGLTTDILISQCSHQVQRARVP